MATQEVSRNANLVSFNSSGHLIHCCHRGTFNAVCAHASQLFGWLSSPYLFDKLLPQFYKLKYLATCHPIIFHRQQSAEIGTPSL